DQARSTGNDYSRSGTNLLRRLRSDLIAGLSFSGIERFAQGRGNCGTRRQFTGAVRAGAHRFSIYGSGVVIAGVSARIRVALAMLATGLCVRIGRSVRIYIGAVLASLNASAAVRRTAGLDTCLSGRRAETYKT